MAEGARYHLRRDVRESVVLGFSIWFSILLVLYPEVVEGNCLRFDFVSKNVKKTNFYKIVCRYRKIMYFCKKLKRISDLETIH